MISVKIQSISDLITNSSSEVFVIYTKEGIEILKSVVSELLGRDFDEHFIIEVNCYEYARRTYNNRGEDEADMSFEDWCFKHNEDWNDYDGPTAIEGLTIIAKNPEDERIARLISAIPYIFDSESRYC